MSTALPDEQTAPALPPFRPVLMMDVELTEPLPGPPEGAGAYERARLLVRLHSIPLGTVDLPIDRSGLDPRQGYAAIWAALGDQVNAHLRLDGLAPVESLDGPLPGVTQPACLRERTAFLERAPFVSIVICTRNRTEYLARCLRHFSSMSYPRYEIIVVDNAPNTDATERLVRGEYGPDGWVRYYREEAPGLSRARNVGLAQARGEIVAFVDDDERPDRHWLTDLARGFELGERVACVAGGIIAEEIETQAQDWLEQFGGQSKGRGLESRVFDANRAHRREYPLYPYFPSLGSGGNMAFRTEVLRRLGGFDPALGAGTVAAGAEDTEAFFRLIAAGYALAYVPSALVHHRHGRTVSGLNRRIRGYGISITAYLTKCVWDDPRRVLELLGLAPRALRYLLSPRSERYAHMKGDFPSRLVLAEIAGMLYGPLAYLQSRARTRAVGARAGRPAAAA